MHDAGSRRYSLAVGALFAISGFSALIYQVVWQRALYAIFGINIESVTITVTAFLLGLGIGSLVGGLMSVRLRAPVIAFAVIELGIAGFGAVSLQVFRAAGSALLGTGTAGTAAATMGLLLIPTLLMGMTLPILVSSELGRGREAGRSVGNLYFVNTMGSAVASALSVTAVLPFLGEQNSVWAAVALNSLVALAAVALVRRSREA